MAKMARFGAVLPRGEYDAPPTARMLPPIPSSAAVATVVVWKRQLHELGHAAGVKKRPTFFLTAAAGTKTRKLKISQFVDLEINFLFLQPVHGDRRQREYK